jgi:hypothetical protein
MLAHYSLVRLGAKRDPLEALAEPPVGTGKGDRLEQQNSDREEGGYVTTHVTKQLRAESIPAELIERYGRHVGTRTPDLYRVKVAL